MRTEALISVLCGLVVTGCSFTEPRSEAALPQLQPIAVADTTAAPATVPATAAERWFATHTAAVRDHADDLRRLAERLGEPGSGATVVGLCKEAADAVTPAVESARQAAGVQPDWATAVDLAHWMLTGCAGGDLGVVPTILPDLTDALDRFDGWQAATTAA